MLMKGLWLASAESFALGRQWSLLQKYSYRKLFSPTAPRRLLHHALCSGATCLLLRSTCNSSPLMKVTHFQNCRVWVPKTICKRELGHSLLLGPQSMVQRCLFLVLTWWCTISTPAFFSPFCLSMERLPSLPPFFSPPIHIHAPCTCQAVSLSTVEILLPLCPPISWVFQEIWPQDSCAWGMRKGQDPPTSPISQYFLQFF